MMKKAGKAICLLVMCVMAVANFASAEIIRGINIDFVTIDYAGNAADTQVMTTDGTTGYGVVDYNYRIGKYEITNAQWKQFVLAAGAPKGDDGGYDYSFHTDNQQPVNYISWYKAAQFCNYLTSGDKSKGAYLFSGNNTNPGSFQGIYRLAAQTTYATIYVIPTEDEWYKAAYFKSNSTSYSLYANGLNAIPAADNGWNYRDGLNGTLWNVGTGTQEQNGTFDMMGNVWEWNENLLFGVFRGVRGGSMYNLNGSLASSTRYGDYPFTEGDYNGLRIVSIPEPASLLLLGLGGLLVRKNRLHSN